MVGNKQVVLNNYVQGWPKEGDFRLQCTETEIESIPNGSEAVLLKNLYLACDPYMRHRMCDNHISQPGTIFKSSFTPGSVSSFSFLYALVSYVGLSHISHQLLYWGITHLLQEFGSCPPRIRVFLFKLAKSHTPLIDCVSLSWVLRNKMGLMLVDFIMNLDIYFLLQSQNLIEELRNSEHFNFYFFFYCY